MIRLTQPFHNFSHLFRYLLLTLVFASVFVIGRNASANSAKTYVVNTRLDSLTVGECTKTTQGCTLREAIAAANSNTGQDTITFNIPVGSGVPVTVALTAPLPALTDSAGVIIDGTSQAGASCDMLLVTLDGSNLNAANATGVRVAAGADGNTIKGLAIVNFSGNGITIKAADQNEIYCNHIGVDHSGTHAAGNGENGIAVTESGDTTIGGVDMGNLIAANSRSGISFIDHLSSGGKVKRGNAIYANQIGAAGLGNGHHGILIADAANIVVGDATMVDMENTIGANGLSGIRLYKADDNIIERNFIGTDAGESADLGNNLHGILIDEESSNNRIGLPFSVGNSLITGNVIANNGADGVAVTDGTSINNSIHANKIYDNAGLSIDLNNDGTTPNDSDDSDSGANRLQNYPTLSNSSADELLIELISQPSTTYTVTLYASPTCAGEATDLLGEVTVTTNVDNYGSSTAALTSTQVTQYAVATATDPDGNTSELSACHEILNVALVNSANDIDDGLCSIGHCSLREAIDEVNAGSANAIFFNMTGAGPHIITPTTSYPAITNRVVIDGTTQGGTVCPTGGASASLMIELDGSLAGESADGLLIKEGGTVRGLAVYRFSSNGISLDQVDGFALTCTHLGTDGRGVTPGLSNGRDGIWLFNANHVTLGGNASGAGNVIISASEDAVEVFNGTELTIANNFIGVGADGVTPLEGGLSGLSLYSVSNVQITNNVTGISSVGIEISRADQLTVAGNYVGISADLATNFGHSTRGISLYDTLTTTIGTIDDPNTIAHNGTGILIDGQSSESTTVNASINHIFNNDDLGVDIVPSGVTENDLLDSDSGINDLLNFPTLTQLSLENNQLIVTGTLAAEPSTQYTLHVYASDACDDSGNGEGQQWLGHFSGTTDASGVYAFSATFNVDSTVSAASHVTMVTSRQYTSSEFSDCAAISVPTNVGLSDQFVFAGDNLTLWFALSLAAVTSLWLARDRFRRVITSRIMKSVIIRPKNSTPHHSRRHTTHMIR